MRVEATKEEWAKLYELGKCFKEIQPWKIFSNEDVFCIEFSEEEKAYFTIMGNGGYMYGFSMYLGIDGFNSLLGLLRRSSLHVGEDYMASRQNNISMFLGDREEVSEEQYAVIRDLGLRFRGKNNWIYFETFEKRYFPYIPTQKEVQECTRYLAKLLDAIAHYRNTNQRAFGYDELYVYKEDNGVWKGEFGEFPLKTFQIYVPILENEVQTKRLQKQKKTKAVWEVDCFLLHDVVRDEAYEKPILPECFLVMDSQKDVVLEECLLGPYEEDAKCASILAQLIIEYGIPQEIIVPNSLVGALIRDVCEKCKIKLTIGITECCEAFKAGVEPYMDEEKMLHTLEEIGIDVEKMRQKAQRMNQDEFVESMMQEMQEAMERMFSEEYALGGDDEAFFLEEHKLKNVQEKADAVRLFYGQGKVDKKRLNDYSRIIEYDYAEVEWEKLLKKLSKKELYDMADKMGALVDKSYKKNMLINIIMSKAHLHPKDLLGLLSKEEYQFMLDLLKHIEVFEDWEDNEIELENFGYSAEQVIKILNLGLLDVELLEGDEVLVLRLCLAEEMREFLL